MPKRDIEDFIKHWSTASASERSNSQTFLAELCDLLEVPRPDNHPGNGYFFEYSVTEQLADGTTSQGRIDLYKRACFVLESKQFQEAKAEASQLELAAEEAGVVVKKKSSQPVRGTGAWDDAMTKARGQAERYVRAIPDDNPPFIIVVDVGHTFEVFADFTQAGKAYLPFPDPRTFRIRLADLANEKIRERLRLIWTNPAALDPAKRSADVTREVSAHLAELAKSLEQAGHEPDIVAQFLTRCLFCMFAEDIGLLPESSFTELLDSLPADGAGFEDLMSQLFREMNTGTGKSISVVLRKKLLQFNGGLFADDTVLPLNGLQLGLLKNAARQNWRNVEPAIFGTLLERALNPGERHQLGAHFTPRAYVERLVLPTVIEPLRAEWANVRAAAITHGARSSERMAKAAEIQAGAQAKQSRGDFKGGVADSRHAKEEEKAASAELDEARTALNGFHARLCDLKVLDPACGTGNFLYVALQQMKVLEGEIFDLAAQFEFGENFRLEMEKSTVDPHQFLGLEINPRAAAIAELVLWIGYLQWHFKLHGKTTPPEPILRAFKNIECRDAILSWDRAKPELDSRGQPVTRWDGRSMRKHPVTGEDVPDETARVPALQYDNPRPAEWPDANFIVGNPPFIGNKRMRLALGDGYVTAVREAWPRVPETVDFVMYWASRATELVTKGKVSRLGFITTNSITQTFNRSVIQSALDVGTRIAFAIPDHPWVDSIDGAQVRVAMSVFDRLSGPGTLWTSKSESPESDGASAVTFDIAYGTIYSDLCTGVDTAMLVPLAANGGLACPGVQLSGQGFVVAPEDVGRFSAATKRHLLRRYITGRDVTQQMREQYVFDTYGLAHDELRDHYPDAFQWLHDRVKPEREQNPREKYRREWWIHAEPRAKFRAALVDLRRFIVTSRTARHRTFQFLDASFLPETKVLIVAFDDAFHLGVLSSRAHVLFANRVGGWLGVGNDSTYNHSDCLEKFPFPHTTEANQTRIRKVAESLDAHRKQQQAEHVNLTITEIYNVLEKVRAGESLDAKDKLIHDQGLVSVLKQLHDNLDAAVFAAYGWPVTITDAEILTRLVALNAERAAEEKRGVIHYLRPEYQARGQKELAMPEGQGTPKAKAKAKAAKKSASSAGTRKLAWPSSLSDRVEAVEQALHKSAAPITAADLAQKFAYARPKDVEEILKTLRNMGRAHQNGTNFTR